MRYLIWLFIMLWGSQVNAREIELRFERTCIYTKNSGNQCEEIKWKRRLMTQGKDWFWINEDRGNIRLRTVSEDKNILVLEGPLNQTHSAIDLVHLSKKTGRFYWSEIGYSEFLGEDHASIQFGKFVETK